MKALWCSITQRLRRDWAALGALVFLAVLVTVAVLAPLLAPYLSLIHISEPTRPY